MITNLFSLINWKRSSLGGVGDACFPISTSRCGMGTNSHAGTAAAPRCSCHPFQHSCIQACQDLNFKRINFEKLRKLVNEVIWIKELRDFNVEKA